MEPRNTTTSDVDVVAENRPEPRTYADEFIDWLDDLGYTHCFFLGGGNIMHLLDAVRTRMVCVPVVHEVAAGIAAEYFNVLSPDQRAFTLVTAGPGLTNIVTAIGGAWLESRELLVVGGQAKTSNLARGLVRQIGHQEIDGVAIVAPICKEAVRVERPFSSTEIAGTVAESWLGRPGPVFLEMCLDVTAAPPFPERSKAAAVNSALPTASEQVVVGLLDRLSKSQRPLLLLGGGVQHETAAGIWDSLEGLGLPGAATWNGADRVPDDLAVSFGRPNTYGRRSSNVLIQQADLVIALGTRLGLQQTGFATDQFAASAYLVQVDIDPNELSKDTLRINQGICADANDLLLRLVAGAREQQMSGQWQGWLDFGREVQRLLPSVEECNTGESVNPMLFVEQLSDRCSPEDVIIPCSSGNTFLAAMQCFKLKRGQRMVTDKGAGSMGYGLSGAIGAAFGASPQRVIHLEGDGGYAQNLQELGTVRAQSLNIKTFVFVNNGYASIRQMQRNYFEGNYLGCDPQTGVGMPAWSALFAAYDIPVHTVPDSGEFDAAMLRSFEAPGPAAFIVPVDPEQTHWPKISSSIAKDGSISSNPLHNMTPPLEASLAGTVLRFIDNDARR